MNLVANNAVATMIQSTLRSPEFALNQRNEVRPVKEKFSEILGKNTGQKNIIEGRDFSIEKRQEQLETFSQRTDLRKTSVQVKEEPKILEEIKVDEKSVIKEIAKLLDMEEEEVEAILSELESDLKEHVFDYTQLEHLQAFVMKVMNFSEPIEFLTSEKSVELVELIQEIVTDSTSSSKVQLEDKPVLELKSQESPHDNLKKTEVFLEKPEGREISIKANTQEKEMSQDTLKEEKPHFSQNLKEEKSASSNPFTHEFNPVLGTKTETIFLNGKIQTIETEVTAKNVFDQIVTAVKVQVTAQKSDVILQLNPEHLGKVAFKMTSEQGHLTGHFVAETEAVKEIIEANLAQLRTQLTNQGLQVKEIKVSVGEGSSFFEGNQEKQSSSKEQQFLKKGKEKQWIKGLEELESLSFETEIRTINEDSSIQFEA